MGGCGRLIGKAGGCEQEQEQERGRGLLVCWSVGLLVCWSVGKNRGRDLPEVCQNVLSSVNGCHYTT